MDLAEPVTEQTIDRFQVQRILGEGGQGIVFLAHDPRLRREVAIKTLTVASAEDAARLLDEARSVSVLRHPCIVPVFEVGDLQGTPYVVFEYVQGETLDALIRRSGALPAEQALALAGQFLDGLAHAHGHGVLHRDFKPANIMLQADGTPRIMDFGAASRTQAGWLNSDQVAVDEQCVGTPPYMAPEYIARREYSARTDIYAAALVIWEMLAGRRLHPAGPDGLDGMLRRIVHQDPPLDGAAGVEPQVLACLRKALARRPEERHTSVLALKEELLQSAQAAPAQADAKGDGSTLEFLLRRIRLKKDFPAMSQAVGEVNGIIFSDKGGVNSLTNAVLKDFALTQKIIKLANSSYYNPGSRANIGTVSAAVYRLGFDTIRNMVLGLMVFDKMKDRDQARELMTQCAQAMLGGSIARELCTQLGLRRTEETFVCAMMHRLGRLLCAYCFPEEYTEITKLLAMGEADEERASRKVLGASYTELGQGVARSWGFPSSIIESMARPPAPGASKAPQAPEAGMHQVAALAAALAEAVLAGPPEGMKERCNKVLDQQGSRMKLDRRGMDKIYGPALEKFQQYAGAVGWRLDSTLGKRLTRMQAELAPPAPEGAVPASDKVDVTLQAITPATTDAPVAPNPVHGDLAVLSSGIQDVTMAMVEGLGLNDVLRIVAETLYCGFHFDHVILALRDTRREAVIGRFGLGEGVDPLVAAFRFPTRFLPDVFHVALHKNTDVFIADSREPGIAMRIPDWHRQAFSARSFVLLPIVVQDRPLGLIYADSALPHAIRMSEEETRLLRTLRNQAVLAVRQQA